MNSIANIESTTVTEDIDGYNEGITELNAEFIDGCIESDSDNESIEPDELFDRDYDNNHEKVIINNSN